MKDTLTTLLAMACLLLGAAGPANAAPVTIYIEGVVDDVIDYDNYLEGQISIGDPITGYYRFDSDTPDQDWLWGSPSLIVGRYHHFSPPSGIYLTIGDLIFQSTHDNVNFLISIVNNNSEGADIYAVSSYNNDPLDNATAVDFIAWQLTDSTGSVFSNDHLLSVAPILDQWTENILRINGTNDAFFMIQGHVTSAVPEPGTLLLIGLGAMGLIVGKTPKN